jgi:ribosomal-protein-alanine N-acetyltransferase
MLRKFSISDLDAIIQIEKESFPKLPYSGSTFMYFASMYPDNFLVYVQDDTETGLRNLVGYLIFYPDGHIVSIAIHTAYRRRGIGSKLVAEVLKRTKGTAIVEVRKSNEVAKKFYTHLGFSVRAVIPRYYGDEDALMMVRTNAKSYCSVR